MKLDRPRTLNEFRGLFIPWVFSSVGERFLHTEEVEGSKPPTPTIAMIEVNPKGLTSFFFLSPMHNYGHECSL